MIATARTFMQVDNDDTAYYQAEEREPFRGYEGTKARWRDAKNIH